MKPQQHPSLPLLPPQKEALSPAERWPREMYIISCRNTSRKPSLALIVANVLRSKQFSNVNLIHSYTMQYVLTLSEQASPRALFVLLWCIHSAFEMLYEIIHRAKLNWSHPTYNPSILLAAIWPYYFGEAKAHALLWKRGLLTTSHSLNCRGPLENDPTSCGAPDTHNRPCRVELVLSKNLMDDPEQITLWSDSKLMAKANNRAVRRWPQVLGEQ